MSKTIVYKYKDGVLIDTVYPEALREEPAKKEVKGASKRKSKKDISLQEEDSNLTEETTPSSK